MYLSELIDFLGVRRVARACCVDPAAVHRWKTSGLPSSPRYSALRANHERSIAKLAGMRVGDLRKAIEENEGQ